MLIESLNNPKLKQYIRIRDSKKYRRECGLAAIEGARLCADALHEEKHGNIEIVAAFATEQAMERYEKFVGECAERFFMISEQASGKLSDTKNPQGVFMLVKAWDKPLAAELLESEGRYAVLDNLQDPGNIGTILRTADALGIDGAVLVNNCCELYNPKLLRSAMGSVFRLPIFTADTLACALECFGKLGITSYAAVVDDNARAVGEFDFANGSAVVIGNEGNGLDKADSSACTEKVTIHMNGNAESLNAASAAAILLWEMSKRG